MHLRIFLKNAYIAASPPPFPSLFSSPQPKCRCASFPKGTQEHICISAEGRRRGKGRGDSFFCHKMLHYLALLFVVLPYTVLIFGRAILSNLRFVSFESRGLWGEEKENREILNKPPATVQVLLLSCVFHIGCNSHSLVSSKLI